MKGFFVVFFVAMMFLGCSGEKDKTADGAEAFESHYPSGQIEAKGQFVNGRMNGIWTSIECSRS